jgi:hypothetical protein
MRHNITKHTRKLDIGLSRCSSLQHHVQQSIQQRSNPSKMMGGVLADGNRWSNVIHVMMTRCCKKIINSKSIA